MIKLLFLVFTLGCSVAKDEWLDLPDTIKEDLFAIYTNTALTERTVVHAPPPPDAVKFFLFTKNNPENFTIIDPTDPQPLNNPNAKIVFIIHGWIEHREKQWYEDLKNAFLKRNPEYYVIQVDWSKLSFQGYLLSSYSTKDVGGLIGNFIVGLHKNFSISLDNFLVVGHSLGGQISGFVGKKVQELTNEKLPRLITLDPAGPLFIGRPEEERLNKNDAKVVQVIHTDGGVFGFSKPCGTIDFFPNGGSHQPGCLFIQIPDPKHISIPVMCDHQRSWMYFIEAVALPQEFPAVTCRTWEGFTTGIFCDKVSVTMGDLETTKTGKFYLKTNYKQPFYKLSKIREILPVNIEL